jgi:ubiquitin
MATPDKITPKTMKPIETQYIVKRKIGFTKTQDESLRKLADYGVNINNFVRIAVREKIKRDWPKIKEHHEKDYCPF